MWLLQHARMAARDILQADAARAADAPAEERVVVEIDEGRIDSLAARRPEEHEVAVPQLPTGSILALRVEIGDRRRRLAEELRGRAVPVERRAQQSQAHPVTRVTPGLSNLIGREV